MNIAIFASAYYPSLGGVEEVCRQLARTFTSAGHGAIIVTDRWPRNLPRRELMEGIAVHRFPMRVPNERWKARISFKLTHRLIRRAIIRLMRQERIDVILVQCVSSTTLYALHARRLMGIPVVITLQGELTMDAGGIFQRPGIAQEIMHRALSEADAITACSRHTLDEARDFHGKLNKNASVIHNGIRLDEFTGVAAYRHPRPYVLAIGRHVKQKGFDALLGSWAAVKNSEYDMILAGDGPEHADLKRLAESLKISDRVVFFGRADRRNVVALFKGCDFFVLPSRHEPFGIVSLEAMAAGKAVLATRVGGVPEVVEDGVTGVLVDPNSQAVMAESLRFLLQSPETVARLGEEGGRRAAAFDWKNLASRYLDILDQVLAGRNHRVAEIESNENSQL